MSSHDSYSILPEDRLPKSSLPPVWVGFFFPGAFMAAEIVEIFSTGLEEELSNVEVSIPMIVIAVAGWAYWLFCVYKFHKVLDEMSRGKCPVMPGLAAFGHIIPFFNLYWFFKWPSELSSYLKSRGGVQIVSGYFIGALLLIFVLTTRWFDAGIGLAGLFAVVAYVNRKLQQYIRTLKEASPNTIPPLPDSQYFKSQEPVEKSNSAG
jgi:Co/Zn/Cd efflux system component